jgi:Ca2+-transporting ATPase
VGGVVLVETVAEPAGHSHVGTVEDLVARLGAHPAHGLSREEATKRLARDGKNELPRGQKPSPLRQLLSQFANPIVLTLIGAAVIAIVNGASNQHEASWMVRYGDAIAILLIVALNAVLGYYQERRAEAALDALQKMQTPNARVRRDDTVAVIAASDIVVGDCLELEAGDAVAADARLLQSINLAAQEGTLTGESMPTFKDARAELPQDAPLGDRANMLFVGTTIVRGKGRAVVVATGARTELGKISALMTKPRETSTPLEEKLERFGKRILWACLALSALLFVWGLARGHRAWHELLLEAVSLAVAAIPEGLPAITTITLALGMQRMARRGAIIRKLAAVETLGSATVICTDKTGTLTQNEMTVREVYCAGVTYGVSGVGYDPTGDIEHPDGTKVDTPNEALNDLFATVALCNNATLEQTAGGGWRTIGDPTEGALLTLAAKAGVPKESVAPSHQVLKELPFDSDRKRMTIVTLDGSGREVVHTKGSADVLLPLCSSQHVEGGTKPLDALTRAAILAEAERMSGESLRVLAVARRELAKTDDLKAIPGADDAPVGAGDVPSTGGETRPSSEIEQRLTFLGLVGMMDPPRGGVREAVKASAEAQVLVVMITGDHKLTAVAIAKELGLWSDSAIALTGQELEKLTDKELDARIDSVRVFARVTAEQKLRIVRAFKARGHVVAMTGDGVNDAPALREAHIGVAMGKDGTDVARQAADMVLADDNFATIVDAVREGRAIWRNIQKFIFFLLSSNAGLVVTVFAASFVPGLPPLRPLMILWINLVTNGLPALALGVDPPDPTQMTEPPRKPTAELLGAREYLGMLAVGVWMGACAMLCYLWRVEPTHTPWHGRAIAFSVLALSPLFHAFNCRSATASIAVLRPLLSVPLVIAVLLSGAIHLVAVLVPQLRPVFQTFEMSSNEWLFLLVLSASIVPAIELLKLLQRLRIVGADLGPMSRRARG